DGGDSGAGRDQTVSSTAATGSLILVLIVIAQLAAGCGRAPDRDDTPPVPSAREESPRSPGAAPFVHFESAAEEAGIDFRHVNGATGEKYVLETLGGGVCVFDYDGDGRLDLYFVQGGALPGFEPAPPPRSALYRNLGGGRFAETTEAAGVGGPDRYGFGCSAADIDGDSDRDLYVTYYGPNVLYRNEGDGTFVEVGADAGVDDAHWGASAGFADYDGDGDLDLYVVNYLDYELESFLYCGENRPGYRTVCHPRNYGSQPDVLYRNRGNGTFENVSVGAGIVDRTGKGLGLVWGDYDGDGDADLYVANDDTPNFLWRNRGDGTFEEVGEVVGVAYSEDGLPQAGMGTDMADYDRDGRLDLFVTNLAEETNELYHNDGDGFFSDRTFPSGLGAASLLSLGFGAFFFDPDDDGLLDLFVANGHIIDNIELYNDTITYEQPAHLYRNLGDGRFERVTTVGAALASSYVGRGAVRFDYDDDGDQDVLMVQNDGPAILLRNTGGPSAHWVTIALRGAAPNLDAVGGRVIVRVEGIERVRYARTAVSYLSQADPRLHFGLGSATSIEWITVDWPGRGGFRERFNPSGIDRFVTLVQGEGRQVD
ncbi:MAG: CRTAC1 family protein, partial [Acidobacteria bacterium]|nr:CRTAC1 family protein [Acidobacteriota bacterium]